MTNFLNNSTWLLFNFDTPKDAFYSVSIWLTILLAAAFLVTVFVISKDKKKKFLKWSGIGAILYAVVLGIIYLSLEFIDMKNGGEILPILFVPILVLLITIGASVVVISLTKKPLYKTICFILVGCAFVATIICIGVHFSKGDAAGMNGITNSDINSWALYLSAIVTTLLTVFLACAFDKSKFELNTKSITYAGISIAMSFALSYLRLVHLPQGGSITLASLLPLMLYSYMFGTKKGLFAGMVYGLLQAIQDPYIIHPAQFILDYPLAFSGIGLCGIFANNEHIKLPQLKFALGGILGGIIRFIMHFLSGSFAFAAFAGDQNPFLYSFLYQAGYVLPDIAIVIVVGVILFSSKSFVNFVTTRNQTVETSNMTA